MTDLDGSKKVRLKTNSKFHRKIYKSKIRWKATSITDLKLTRYIKEKKLKLGSMTDLDNKKEMSQLDR